MPSAGRKDSDGWIVLKNPAAGGNTDRTHAQPGSGVTFISVPQVAGISYRPGITLRFGVFAAR